MNSTDHGIEKVFKAYVGNIYYMSDQWFFKIFTDHHLLDSDLTLADLPCIYEKAAKANSKGLSFEEFKEALNLAAEKKGTPLKVMLVILSNCKGPKFRKRTPEKA